MVECPKPDFIFQCPAMGLANKILEENNLFAYRHMIYFRRFI